MQILGVHLEHDAAAASLENGRLQWYHEVQKDNHRRYAHMSPEALDALVHGMDVPPEVVAIGGWFNRAGGYHGTSEQVITREPLCSGDRTIEWFATSHERAHAFCAYGLSPYEQGQPCYLLIWEGDINSFCAVERDCSIVPLCHPLTEPGHRYAFLYELAHPCFDDRSRGWSYDVAGKLMALAGVRDEASPGDDELAAALLDRCGRSASPSSWPCRRSSP